MVTSASASAVPKPNSQVVVVTGASAGVGRAIARAYGQRGARIGLLARGKDGLEGARRDVEQRGGQALVLPTDVADADQVEAAAAAVERAFGPIDIWINNAMVSVFSPIKEMAPEEFRRVTEVTYLGYVYGTLAALRRMLPRDRGVIVQVGSALAYRGIPLQAAYCGAKHAIQGFTDSLRCELLHDGSAVRVTEVHMPALNTPQFGWVKSRLPNKPQPVPPIFQPEVAAEAILWAADNERAELHVGLPTVVAITGNKLAPRLADRYLAWKGYESQQTSEPVEPDRVDNLWAPVPGDHGAHGDFADRARSRSWQLLGHDASELAGGCGRRPRSGGRRTPGWPPRDTAAVAPLTEGPKGAGRRLKGLTLRIISALGEHVLTADVDDALAALRPRSAPPSATRPPPP